MKRIQAKLLVSFLLNWVGMAQPPAHVWETQGFDAFRKGEFDSGEANLYVSRRGVLQTVHRWDVNNDGYFDLIFNNTHDLVYTVPAYEYRFTAKKRYEPERIEYPGAGSVHILAADLNGDRFPDLIIGRGFDNSSRVQNSWIYWGSAEGWRESRHAEVPTPYAQDVCVADLNGDRRPDLIFIASGEHGADTSYVYWGREDGYFYRDRTSFRTPGANGCLVTDLDGDGFNDLIVTAAGRNGKIFWGQPKGMNFAAPAQLPSADTVGAARLGKRLIVSTRKGPEIFSLARRELRLDQRVPFEGAKRIAVADLNGDGVADLVVTRAVVARKWETTSRIFWGRGQPDRERFEASSSIDLPTLGAADVAIADIDEDGFPDLVFANSRSTLSFDVDSYVYWGSATGYSEKQRTALPTRGAQRASVLGRSVFFANSVSGRPIGDIDTYVYFGDKEGRYSPARMQRLPTIGGYESCLADLNDDGYTDALLVGSHEGDLGSKVGSYIYWGSTQGLSASRRSEAPSRGAIGCAIADLNRDGYLDLLFSNMEDDTISILFGGPEGFDPKREAVLPVKGPRFPALADLNRDGFLDLLIPSVSEGLYIFWGSASGYSARNRMLLPSVGAVSQQIADLNGDGWLDIILCNLMDTERWFYRGINSQIYWGSAGGYSAFRRTELPSLGAHHAAVADFNHDGFLDTFLSNYQSEFTRSLDSHIYWGNRESTYTPGNRHALHNESAAGVIAADLNGDGWVDLAVSNHVQNGDHHANSLIFWNRTGRFDDRDMTALPTVGPHMMTGVDPGNLYTRAMEESYLSPPHDAGASLAPVWSQNWICMKMRYFATAARRSR
jgi:hypothetical protein